MRVVAGSRVPAVPRTNPGMHSPVSLANDEAETAARSSRPGTALRARGADGPLPEGAARTAGQLLEDRVQRHCPQPCACTARAGQHLPVRYLDDQVHHRRADPADRRLQGPDSDVHPALPATALATAPARPTASTKTSRVPARSRLGRRPLRANDCRSASRRHGVAFFPAS